MRDKDFCRVLGIIYNLFDALIASDIPHTLQGRRFELMAKEPLKELGEEIEAMGGSIPELKEPC